MLFCVLKYQYAETYILKGDKDNEGFFIGNFFAQCFWGFGSDLNVVTNTVTKKTNKELIERKLKHYDQQTGELVWKGEKL